MKKKGRLYYADWRDERGVRKRKGFTNRAATEKYTRERRREVAAKKARPGVRAR